MIDSPQLYYFFAGLSLVLGSYMLYRKAQRETRMLTPLDPWLVDDDRADRTYTESVQPIDEDSDERGEA